MVRPGVVLGAASCVADKLAAKPLVVLTADSGHDAAWTAQNRLATLSTNSVHRAATTQAILDIVASVRSEAPLVK